MFYIVAPTAPPNTLESDPIEERLTLALGIVEKVQVEFPSGCAGLCHVKIYHREQQIWPTNPDGDFSTNDQNIGFAENYLLDSVPAELVIKVWNDDDRYEHTPKVRILLRKRPENSLLDRLKELVSRG